MRKVLHIIAMALIAAFFVVTIGFISLERRKLVCNEVVVNVKDSLEVRFVTSSQIVKELRGEKYKIFGVKFDSLNLQGIEDKLRNNPCIKDVELYSGLGGFRKGYQSHIVVDIEQHKPVLRVINNSGSYYLNEYGEKMPVVSNYSPYVLLVTGNVNHAYAKEKLLDLAAYVNGSKFWQGQIEQLYVNSKKEILLVPRIGDHIIELGSSKDFKKKFRNLMLFYKEGLKGNDWNKYKSISLKYQNQIVCTKK
ncbi:hypothetical protein EYV94_18990 [Puteibacter caeruleilacunae]|nr:hypothetical protein EYV94_18990 [Puteibacter caeruleilacunae]